MSNHNLALPFWSSSLKNPSRLALVADQQMTYQELSDQMRCVAGWLGERRRVAILASRSAAACISVLACAWTGATYLPLGLDWPPERLSAALQSFRPEALLTDERGQALLTPELERLVPVQARADRLQHPPAAEPARVDEEAIAYVIFTSGSSGQPKGVMVRAAGVRQLMNRLVRELDLNQPYRVAGNFELCFDGSILDMFPCWGNGGTLYLVPRQQAMAPHSFLAQHHIQAFVLTPAHLHLMLRLKAPVLPELRWCAFGAEALARSAVDKWRQLAPQARIFNLYGPTEGTVAWMWHEVGQSGPQDRELVPLGQCFTGLAAEVSSDSGELVLLGDQVAAGYWEQPEQTRQRFVRAQDQPAYRTGDRVRQDSRGLFHFLGRIDNQVKIRGCRVELEEVEQVLMRSDPACQAVVLSWPDRPGELNQLVAFVAGARVSQAELWQSLQSELPEFMLPSQLHLLESLPLNSSGKVDKAQLRSRLRA